MHIPMVISYEEAIKPCVWQVHSFHVYYSELGSHLIRSFMLNVEVTSDKVLLVKSLDGLDLHSNDNHYIQYDIFYGTTTSLN